MHYREGRRMVPGAWFLASLGVMVALDSVLTGSRLIPAPWRYGGIALILTGLGVSLWALHLFKRAGTTLRPSKAPTILVVRGAFRFSRHPMYLGLTVALCGVAVLLSSLASWGIVLVFFLFVAVPAALAEEKLMEGTFGEGYRQYKRTVRRWL